MTGLSGNQGDNIRFTFDVPAQATQVSFNLSGGTGDADLYIQHGSQPTTSSYLCRSWNENTNTESCIESAVAGTYHVLINGWSSFSGASLVADYTEGGQVSFFENYQQLSDPRCIELRRKSH